MRSQFQYSELEETNFSVESQFHVLKHFKRVDRDYVKYLTNHSEYTADDIAHQLAVRGSDFYEGFAPNPLNLWQRLKEKIRDDAIRVTWHNGKCEIELKFSKSEYPEGIGEDHLLHIDELPPGILDKVDTSNWENLRKVSYRKELKSTWTLQIILRKIKGSTEVISVFPGIYAPQLPDKELQSEEEYKTSLKFWKTHVVLKM